VPSSERAHFVHALLRYFIVRARIVAALRSFLSAEIARSLDLATLFRPATLCTSLMDQYMRVRCHRFLVESLEVPLSKIGSNNGQISFELDPSKCTDPVQRDHNLVAFKSAIRDLVTAICSPQSVAQFPVELKHLFWMVRHQVHAKWLQIKQQQQQQCSSSCSSQSSTSSSRERLDDEDVHMTDVSTIKPKFVCPPSDQLGDDKLVRVYCVSAFVFLRLLCPAMISPKNFGLKFAVVASKHQQKLEREFSVSNANNHNNVNRFDYASLGAQFNVFSPSFLFDLQPKTRSQKRSSSTLTREQQDRDHGSSVEQISCFTLTTTNGSHHQNHHQNGVNTLNQTNMLNNTNANNNNNQMQQSAQIYERHVKLLAKVLQTMANMTECKEPFMQPLSEFLNQNKSRIVNFIDEIATPQHDALDSELSSTSDDSMELTLEYEPQTPKQHQNSSHLEDDDVDDDLDDEERRISFKYAECKYLAVLHRLLNSFVPQMRTYLSTSSGDESMVEFGDSLRSLIDILDDINRRVNK